MNKTLSLSLYRTICVCVCHVSAKTLQTPTLSPSDPKSQTLLSLFCKNSSKPSLPLSLSPSDPKSKTQTLTGITMSEKEKMDKENTHRQSSEPEEKNKEREVTTEREDGRKETEETNPCKEHFHPSTRMAPKVMEQLHGYDFKSVDMFLASVLSCLLFF
ncbi:unnamed protein product [Camellia sinensis]